MADSNKHCVVIFDEGKSTEKKFYFDSLSETLSMDTASFSTHYSINDTLPQNLKDFVDFYFDTIKVLDFSDNQVPVYGNYTKVTYVGTNFFGADGVYNIDLRVGNE